MKTNYIYILLGFILTSLVTACTDDWDMPEQSKLSGEEVYVTLDFGFSDFEEVNITTRATASEIAESRVHNLFVYIFTNDGKRIYSKYFEDANKVDESDFMSNRGKDCWWVKNQNNKSNPPVSTSHGQIGMKAPMVNTAKLYIIANIDADMVNISPEKMNAIIAEADVLDLTAKLNQITTSRNGYFPMAFKMDGINVGKDKIILPDNKKVLLERLDAKIQFKFSVAKKKEKAATSPSKIDTIQKIKAFMPESWRIVNIPKGSYIFNHGYDNEEVGYFNTDFWKFETTDKVINNNGTVFYHGFSFYMLENRKTKAREIEGKASVGSNYHLRDKRNKNEYGKYDNTNGLWAHAPEKGTYLEVKGRVLMEVDVSNEAKTQQLEADVIYCIHLGDFNLSMDNYDVNRNTVYTYNVTIHGVKNIEVEVRSSQAKQPDQVIENEAGATGMVYVAKEEIYTFDAHYGQRVFCFDAAYIEPKTVTWYVKTPFGKEGIPDKVGDTEVPAGMDYKWVHFCNNPIDEKNTDPLYTELDKPYSHLNQAYPGNKCKDKAVADRERKPWLMNVVEFTKYIKDQKRKLSAGKPNDFRKEFDPLWYDKFCTNKNDQAKKDKSKIWWRDRIYMTVFVDEFYYEADPINGDQPKDLWKKFVNQPNRLMHVLCDSERSLDGESTATGSVITLRQRSIQTPYNVQKATLTTAWGCESVDETANKYLWFYEGEDNFDRATIPEPNNELNTSKYNGAYNTAYLWGLTPNGSDIYWTGETGLLDYNVNNESNMIFLKEGKASMRYASLMRNRDNNGNGVIDLDEIRWYIASIDQLYGLYIGQYGVNDEAALYTQQRAENDGKITIKGQTADLWRYHVVSSTKSSEDAYPIELWAEEGVSTSPYKKYSGEKPAPYAIRCVRNLGIDPKNQFQSSPNHEVEGVSIPTKLIQVRVPTNPEDPNSVYQFDLSNVNKQSLRFYTTHELEPENEFSEMSLPYVGFETGPTYPIEGGYKIGIYDLLLGGFSPCGKSKYRVPNVREGALMSLYCTNSNWWSKGNTFVTSWYSNGVLGTDKDTKKDYYSWQFGNNWASIDLDNPVPNNVRSVRDWNPPLQ